MSKIGVIGHFGIGLNLANGQTIKTKIITDELRKKYNNDVNIVDTHGGIKNIFKVIRNTINLIKNCDNIIIMVTENGLKTLVPVLIKFNRKYKRKLHYVVIGGWLESFLKSKGGIKNKLKKFDCIYVETTTMKKQLTNMGFSNVLIMPNCKDLNIIDKKEIEKKKIIEPVKLCTFSRVMKEKGIEDAINAVIDINNKYNKIGCSLNIYGEIDVNQTEWFNNLKKSFPKFIKYCGVAKYDKSVNILKKYDVLLFPTHFYTEGIPGTIIDAYAAGIPVISSKWESFNDVVDDNKTGLGYNFNSFDDFKNKIDKIVNNPNLIKELSNNCIEKANDFKIENVMKVLYAQIV